MVCYSFLQLLLNLPIPSLFKCLTNIYYCFLLICCSLKVLYFHYFCVCCNMKVAFFCLFVEVLVQLGFFFFSYICYALWYMSGRVAYKDESTWYKWYKAVVGREWAWRQIQLNWKAHSANSSRIDQSLNFLSLTVLSLLTRRVLIFNFQVSIITYSIGLLWGLNENHVWHRVWRTIDDQLIWVLFLH